LSDFTAIFSNRKSYQPIFWLFLLQLVLFVTNYRTKLVISTVLRDSMPVKSKTYGE